MVAIKLKIQRRAISKLDNAVLSGRIQRSDSCELCDKEANTHGHHPDYRKPLFVIWLCPKCHSDWHQLIREIQVFDFADKISIYFENIEVNKVKKHEYLRGHHLDKNPLSDISRRFLREYPEII